MLYFSLFGSVMLKVHKLNIEIWKSEYAFSLGYLYLMGPLPIMLTYWVPKQQLFHGKILKMTLHWYFFLVKKIGNKHLLNLLSLISVLGWMIVFIFIFLGTNWQICSNDNKRDGFNNQKRSVWSLAGDTVQSDWTNRTEVRDTLSVWLDRQILNKISDWTDRY